MEDEALEPFEVDADLTYVADRYESLKREIKHWWADRQAVGAMLKEIQENKWYQRDGYKSFEDFCEQEFDIGVRTAYRLIQGIGVLEGLNEPERITNERQARALALVEPEERNAVLEEIEGPVTAAAIEKVVKERQVGQMQDRTGYAIPDNIAVFWRHAEDQKDLLRSAQGIRARLKEAKNNQDPAYAELTANTLATLGNLIKDLKRLVPFAVCTTCEGLKPGACTFCMGKGWISEFLWDNAVPQDVKDIRF